MHYELTAEQLDIKKAAREFAEGEFPDVALEYDKKEAELMAQLEAIRKYKEEKAKKG